MPVSKVTIIPGYQIFCAKTQMVLCNLGWLVTLPVSKMLLSEEITGCLREDLTQAEPVEYRKPPLIQHSVVSGAAWSVAIWGEIESRQVGNCRRRWRGLQIWIIFQVQQKPL